MAPSVAKAPSRKVSHKKKKAKRKDVTKHSKEIKIAAGGLTSKSAIISPDQQCRASVRPNSNKKNTALGSFQRKINVTKPVVLDGSKLFIWARNQFHHKGPQSVAAVKRHAINDFKPMRYTKKLKIAPGPSPRIAATASRPAAPSKPTKPTMPAIMSTEYLHLRRYLLEDLLFCSIGHPVVICVAPKHPNYNLFALLELKSNIKIPTRLIGKTTYLQLNAVITKHARQNDLLEGTIDVATMNHLLFENGNESIGFEFIHATEEELLLTWKSFFLHADSIQVWGSLPPRQNLYISAFRPIQSNANRHALFKQLYIELSGDRASTFD